MKIGNKYRNVRQVRKEAPYLAHLLSEFLEDDDEWIVYRRKKNIKLEVGCHIQVERWDWNGQCNVEEIIRLDVINNKVVQVYTKNGKVKFDITKEYNSGVFEWENKRKYSWESKYQQNVDFSNYYYQS